MSAAPADPAALKRTPDEGEGDPLERPAGTFLESVPWEGPSPDPDVLDAAAFLAWL